MSVVRATALAAALLALVSAGIARADEMVARIETRGMGGAAMTFLLFGPERGQLMCYVEAWSFWLGLYLACDDCELPAPDCVLLSTLGEDAAGMQDRIGLDIPYAAAGNVRVTFDGVADDALLDICRRFAGTLAADEDPDALCIEPAP